MVNKDNITAYLDRFLRPLPAYALYCLRKRSGYLHSAGWFESFRSGIPEDGVGNPLPWMTYPAIAFLGERVRKEMTVFEYGCGGSTLWWADRVGRVVSAEHDAKWYDRMKGKIPSNVELHHIPLVYGGDYGRKVADYPGSFDIIVNDGRDRNACARHCLGSLKPEGVVVWDNSEREHYAEGFAFLKAQGFKKLDFDGMGPVNVYPWRTSIFYRNVNCLDL